VRLCDLEAIDDGKARGFVDRCPHLGAPLAHQLDDYLTPDGCFIACGWDGAIFSLADGLCLGGPCQGQSLMPWPVTVTDGAILTASMQPSGRRSRRPG
jgi:nitrite reductase/ring-hydroxylating ferredoxin subunit